MGRLPVGATTETRRAEQLHRFIPTLANMAVAPSSSSSEIPVGDVVAVAPSSSSSEIRVGDVVAVAVIAVVILIVTVTVIIRCVQVIIRCVQKLTTVIIRCVQKLMTVIIRCVRVIIRCVQVIIRCVKKLMTVIIMWNFKGAKMERFLNNFLKEKPMRFTSQQLIHITNKYAEKLGSGGFGTVYKGQHPNGVAVAVKVLHKTTDKRAEEQFMAEVATIGRTYHINLVRLYGFCFDASVKALVYEYMENGSLDQYLLDKGKRPRWEKLYEIAIGTAKGIRYLHEECQRRVIHYDIKPGNILLDASFFPKIADFGLAKLSDRNNTHGTLTGDRGTPGYAAPEVYSNNTPVTYKCDVYSYGILLFEILGLRRNLDLSQEWFPKWAREKPKQGEMESMLSQCGVEGDNKVAAARLFKVALWCIQHQPETRPTMSNVVRMIEGEQEIPSA